MKKLICLLIAVTVSLPLLAADLNRYYTADKRPQNNKATAGAYSLETKTRQEWNDSANIDNLVFDETAKTVRFKTAAEKEEDRIQNIINRMDAVHKIDIRRTMRAAGIEAKLDALLTNETFKKDWDDSGSTIYLSDPIVVQAMAAGGISAEEIAAIKRAIAQKIIDASKPAKLSESTATDSEPAE